MLSIGWASQDMTPQRPAMIQGQKHRRIGYQAMDALTVTALAIENADLTDSAILISCDLAYVSDELLKGVLRRLARRLPSVSGEKVVMAATHTHTSLVIEDGFYSQPDGDVMTPQECETWVADVAAQAAVAAWENRTPRHVGRAFGHAVVGHNRYALYTHGHAQMYGATHRSDFSTIGGYEDHSVDMLLTWDVDGTPAGVAIAIPCPSQVDEGLQVFSADFWHDIRLELCQRYKKPLEVLALCSAAGDQSPHLLLYHREEAEMRKRRGITERREIAIRVADAVDRALECTPPSAEDTDFAHVTRHIQLAPICITQEQRDWAEVELEKCQTSGDLSSWWPQRLRQVVKIFDGQHPQKPFPAELHILRIGNAVFATNPFELFLDYSLQMKATSPAAQTFIIQLAGRGWYLPTERALKAGGYGANPVVCQVGPVGGRQLVEETLKSIGQLFESQCESL